MSAVSPAPANPATPPAPRSAPHPTRPVRLSRTLFILAAATIAGTGTRPAAAQTIDTLPGFSRSRVCEGITGGTSLAALPDGRLLIGEQTGDIRIVKNGSLLEKPALTLPTDSTWERGVLGLALAPGFPDPPHVFIHWTAARPAPHTRLSRFTLQGDSLDPASEKILFEGDSQNDLRAPVPAGHQGGGIAIGPDQCLYAAIGDMTAQQPSQRLDSLLGKVIRIRLDGTIPEDNPFVSRTSGKYRALFALGLRNPFSLAFHPQNGRLFANDIGQASYEEVNEIVAGANYGWPDAEGRVEMDRFRDPLLDYGRTIGGSLGGGCFYQAPAGAPHAFPREWNGRYLLMDFMAGWLAWIDETATPRPQLKLIARNLAKPVAVTVAADGSLLVLERNTWLKDQSFKPRQGWLTRIQPATGTTGTTAAAPTTAPPAAPAPAVASTWPPRWSAADFERDSIAYQLSVEPWRPGATFERRVVLPGGAKLTATPDGSEFVLPPGLLVVTHASAGGRRIQTTLVRVQPQPPHHAAVYRWQDDGRDATLVTTAATATVNNFPWSFPEPTTQLTLPVVLPGYDAELRPPNLHPDSPLSAHITSPPLRHRLIPLDHPKAAAEEKIRSFLDVNCSACHRPGGIGRGLYDARATTPLARQQLINGPLLSGDLGVPGAMAVVPGHPEKSMLVIRLKKPPGDPMRMPPACASPATPPVLPLLESWIRGLK